MEQIFLLFGIFALGGYLLGSIPFGLVFTRFAGIDDIRKIGSKNIGSTNVLRTGRKDLAIATLLADILKGTIAVGLASLIIAKVPLNITLESELVILAITGFATFVGHVFPIWLGFKGGKGVATYLGVSLALTPLLAITFIAIWLATAYLFRYSSLAALISCVIAPILAWWFYHIIIAFTFSVMSAVIFYKHKTNIIRLCHGDEPKIITG